MAASKWQVYNEAKKYICNGTVDLDVGTIRMKIVKGTDAAVVSNYTRSSFASSVGTGLTFSGATTVRTPPNVSVRMSSGSVMVFDFDAVVFTASGSLTSLQYAVIGVSAGVAIAWCKLSTAAFALTAGNSLTITPAAAGVFTLSGGTVA